MLAMGVRELKSQRETFSHCHLACCSKLRDSIDLTESLCSLRMVLQGDPCELGKGFRLHECAVEVEDEVSGRLPHK